MDGFQVYFDYEVIKHQVLNLTVTICDNVPYNFIEYMNIKYINIINTVVLLNTPPHQWSLLLCGHDFGDQILKRCT